jgi:hypothetical protein
MISKTFHLNKLIESKSLLKNVFDIALSRKCPAKWKE